MVRERIAARFVNAIYGPATLPTEMISAMIITWWGVWLTSPWWTAFSPVIFYRGLIAMAPEYVWGIVAMGIGICHLVALLMINDSPRRLRLRRMIVAFEFIFWVIVSIGYLPVWQSTAMVIYPGLAALAAWCYLRMAVQNDE